MTVAKIRKQKSQKHCHKKKLVFEDYKICLEATQLETRTNHLRKFGPNSLKR